MRFFILGLVLLGGLAFGQADCPVGFRKLALGSHFDYDAQELRFRLFSARAERVELLLFSDPHGDPIATLALEKSPAGDIWALSVAKEKLRELGLLAGNGTLSRPVYYGYRAWGPNWEYRGEWKPGTDLGFKADVDAEGNRFNPNKLLLDPYAREVSHDPRQPGMKDDLAFASGAQTRAVDTTKLAPKGIVLPEPAPLKEPRPERPWREDVVYEVHLRGFTMNDPNIPENERGTFRGAARKAKYLKELGVTAVEFLPVQETQNDANRPDETKGTNYWGYLTLNYFAPDRHYATRESAAQPGGVTREFQEMIEAFHREGIKVILDVVYNHTGEGGTWGPNGENAMLFSFRGIDNHSYYQTAEDKRYYKDNTGCGANFNCGNSPVGDLVIDSLKYFRDLGVDGFRFDLAPILGNTVTSGNTFNFDKLPENNPLNRILRELPARSAEGGAGVDVIAEPWGIGDNSYQLGGFPNHPQDKRAWSEWNGEFRNTVRKTLNKVGSADVTPGEVAARLAGSPDIFGPGGRKPYASVNFVVAHDGFTLKDLVSYNEKQNNQPAPFGPSDGGEDNNNSWDQGSLPNDNPQAQATRQRQAARNGFALPVVAFGVPMFTGGDEFLRTQRGNNNMYNVDSPGSWVNWSERDKAGRFPDFARAILRFRQAHAAFRPAEYFEGKDHDGNGLKDITWLRADGAEADADYMKNASARFLGYRVDAEERGEKDTRSIFVAYNWSTEGGAVTLPEPAPGKRWYWVGDTDAKFEGQGNFREPGQELAVKDVAGDERKYNMAARSLAVFVER